MAVQLASKRYNRCMSSCSTNFKTFSGLKLSYHKSELYIHSHNTAIYSCPIWLSRNRHASNRYHMAVQLAALIDTIWPRVEARPSISSRIIVLTSDDNPDDDDDSLNASPAWNKVSFLKDYSLLLKLLR